MEYSIKAMDRNVAQEVSTWKYPSQYAIYNMDADEESMKEMLGGTFYSVFRGMKLMGYFCYGHSARIPWAEENGLYPQGYTDIGLAMRPDLTGQGQGLSFFKLGLDFARKTFPQLPVRLTVAVFNQRAHTVYLRAGFMDINRFTLPQGKEFIIMVGPKPGQ